MDVKFGTSGLRGLATDLLSGIAAHHVSSFIRHLRSSGQVSAGDEVLVGRDLRRSSPALARQCLAALWNAGMKPVDCGAVAAPALALLGLHRRQAAIMVTGSHIPADRNGIKFYSPAGEITKADEEAISAGTRQTAVQPELHSGTAQAREGSQEAWAGYYERYLPLRASRSFAGRRIGIYQHSSVMRDLLVELLAAFGADAVPLARSDEFVPVDTEALSDDAETMLAAWAREHSLDAIISTDADGDRPLVTDEMGRQIRGDILGIVTANFIKADLIATPVTSSSGLEAAFPGQIIRTRVGSPFVIAAMNDAASDKAQIIAGFEANGGFLLGSRAMIEDAEFVPLPTRDSVLPIIATLAAPASGVTLSEMVRAIGLPVARSDRIENYPSDKSAALLDGLTKSPGKRSAFVEGIGELEEYDTIDGLRMKLAGGEIVHLRASGNAPEMRCYVEAENDKRAASLLKRSLERIRAFQPS